MKLSIIFIWINLMLIISPGFGGKLCSKENSRKVQEEFFMCQAKAQIKFRTENLQICKFFDETLNHCANLLKYCVSKRKLWRIKENAIRVSVRALSLERKINFENCTVLQGMDITPQLSEDKIVDGKCTEKEFHDTYKRFYDCRTKSEASLKNLDPDEFAKNMDDIICRHFKHTLDNCFQEIRTCSKSKKQWIASRRAFISSAIKANEQRKSGLNLEKCQLKADPAEE